jgi:hypothetical protein
VKDRHRALDSLQELAIRIISAGNISVGVGRLDKYKTIVKIRVTQGQCEVNEAEEESSEKLSYQETDRPDRASRSRWN